MKNGNAEGVTRGDKYFAMITWGRKSDGDTGEDGVISYLNFFAKSRFGNDRQRRINQSFIFKVKSSIHNLLPMFK